MSKPDALIIIMQYKMINTMLSIVKWISGKTTAVLLCKKNDSDVT